MTATDELCRMLDERGVEWDTFSVSNTEYTHWTNNDGHWCAASIGGPLSLHVNILSVTPEQAIAATLGRGTCHITDNGPWGYPYVCSECSASFDPDVNGGDFNFCPNCGRKVVDE